MKKLVPIIFGLFMLAVFPVSGQDFYGATNTGKYTFGVSFKYNGDYWLGANFNLVGNNGPFNRAMNYNFLAEVKLDEGFGGVGSEYRQFIFRP